MELIPEVIYSNPVIAGGIRINLPDIIKLFSNVVKVTKVKRSMISFRMGTDREIPYIYSCYDPEVSARINGTKIRIRGIARDLSTIYVYDLTTDQFIISLKETIAPYGDKKSESDTDIKRRMAHSQKLKKYKRTLNQQSAEIDKEVIELRIDQEELENLEII